MTIGLVPTLYKPFFYNLNNKKMNPNKTISANSKGITINFGDVNKHKFVYYSNNDNVRKIQQYGTRKYQHLEATEFNAIQQNLYNQVVYGLKSIPNEVIMEMKVEKIRRIQSLHNKAKVIINNYKQEVAFSGVDRILAALFPKSPVVKQMLEVNEIDPMISVSVSLRDLKITPKMLAQRLMQYDVLPQNFFNLA
jgi:hypothetical protein